MPGHISTDFEVLHPQDIKDGDLCEVVVSEYTWHLSEMTYVTGLCVLIDFFNLWHESQRLSDPDVRQVQNYLHLVLTSLDHAPPKLRWRGRLSRPLGSNFGTDIQMVNLYISQIHIRAFLLDQLYGLAGKSNDLSVLASVDLARKDLVNDMLATTDQVPHDTLEANGNSLITKLRDIELALLDDDGNMNLERLLAKLDRLDIRSAGQTETTSLLTTSTSPDFVL